MFTETQSFIPLTPSPRTNTGVFMSLIGSWRTRPWVSSHALRASRKPACWKKCLRNHQRVNGDATSPVDIHDPPYIMCAYFLRYNWSITGTKSTNYTFFTSVIYLPYLQQKWLQLRIFKLCITLLYMLIENTPMFKWNSCSLSYSIFWHKISYLSCILITVLFSDHTWQSYSADVWKAIVDVPCNLQRVVINLQRVVECSQWQAFLFTPCCSVSDLQRVVGRLSVINEWHSQPTTPT